MQKLKIFCI